MLIKKRLIGEKKGLSVTGGVTNDVSQFMSLPLYNDTAISECILESFCVF